MRKEDKALLVKDLCGRLPYGVKVECVRDPDLGCCDLEMVDIKEDEVYISTHNPEYTNRYEPIENIRPYLFPLSSMTEEQEMEFNGLLSEVYDFTFRMEELLELIQIQKDIPFRYIDWLNANNFDCRGLVPKGLAKDATGLGIY